MELSSNYKITKLNYGNTNTFLIRGTSGNLLIDTDYAGTLSSFYREIKKYDIGLSDITYVLATHYHPDHIGLVGDLEPLDYLDAYEENVELKRDWELVMSYRPKKIHYSHANERIIS